MKAKLIFTALIVLVIVSCRKKSSDDYSYYETQKADTVAAIDTTPVENPVVEEVEEVVEEDAVKGVNLNDSYFLVVASYTVEDFATEQKQKLTDLGFKPEVFMINDDGWYKLAVESYTSEADAKAGLLNLKAKNEMFKQAYVVFKKSK